MEKYSVLEFGRGLFDEIIESENLVGACKQFLQAFFDMDKDFDAEESKHGDSAIIKAYPKREFYHRFKNPTQKQTFIIINSKDVKRIIGSPSTKKR